MFINQKGSPLLHFAALCDIFRIFFFKKNVLRFLSLRYSADLRRSRLVKLWFLSYVGCPSSIFWNCNFDNILTTVSLRILKNLIFVNLARATDLAVPACFVYCVTPRLHRALFVKIVQVENLEE